MKQLPKELQNWYFKFNWDLDKLWSLNISVETKSFSDLKWHLDIPIWSSEKGKMLFNLCPSYVLQNPGIYPQHDKRIAEVDISFPLEMMFTVDRFAIIDGIHRLAKYAQLGIKEVKVRIIPRSYIPLFATDFEE
jgi:hypothetical protein